MEVHKFWLVFSYSTPYQCQCLSIWLFMCLITTHLLFPQFYRLHIQHKSWVWNGLCFSVCHRKCSGRANFCLACNTIGSNCIFKNNNICQYLQTNQVEFMLISRTQENPAHRYILSFTYVTELEKNLKNFEIREQLVDSLV